MTYTKFMPCIFYFKMFHASVNDIKNNIAICFTEGHKKLANYTFPSKNRSVRCQFQIAVSSFVSNQL